MLLILKGLSSKMLLNIANFLIRNVCETEFLKYFIIRNESFLRNLGEILFCEKQCEQVVLAPYRPK